MSLDTAYFQYLECKRCPHGTDCSDCEAKIKAALCREDPLKKLAPINPLRPYQPYKSKYYDDHRYDPPKKATAKQVICEKEKLNAMWLMR